METLKKILEGIKTLFNKEKKNKFGENLIVFIIIGIIIIIAGGTFFDNRNQEKKTPPQDNEEVEMVATMKGESEKNDVEKKMEELLSQINGAGKVTVMVTYVSMKEIVPYSDVKKNLNNTDEKDSSGGTRKVSQDTYESSIAYEEGEDGKKKPIIVKELTPEVKGVVVISDGARDASVKENLVNAVKVLMDIPVHRVQVFQR